MVIDVTWQQFKDQVDSKSLNVQHFDNGDRYQLIAIDGAFSITCTLDKHKHSVDVAVFESSYMPESNKKVNTGLQPFASKVLEDGKKLYKRVHGSAHAVTPGTNSLQFQVPYINCKITGMEIMNGELGDKLQFKVLDTTTGTITTIPNYMLNQFGFDVYITPDLHREDSNYDADLIQDMGILIEYETTSTKTVYINYILHEVK